MILVFFFSYLFSLQVLWENSEPIQTVFRASHGKAHSLGSLNFIVLCEEIILLCSLILALASFIQCPLAQGSAEPFLIYLFHSSHYFINHSKSFYRICLWGWGALVKLFFNQIGISKPPLPSDTHRHGIALSSDTWTWREIETEFPIFPQKKFSLSHVWLLFCGQKIDHFITESNSEDWARNKQRSTRIFNAKYTWTCYFQNHRIVFQLLWLGVFFKVFF